VENLALKIKISILWLFYVVALVAYMTLAGFEPGALEQVMAGEIDGMKITPELMLLFAILFLAPLIMAVLTLTLKDKANRWTNLIVGTVFVIIQIAALAETLAQPSAWTILMEISKLIAPALILWYAYKWPKQKE
jgi:uncharacterized membrane protein HdeD (DUF308 family)